MPRPLALAAVPLAALAFLAAGCGGGGKSDTESTSDWANSVCSAITTWSSSLTDTVNSVQSGNLSKGSIQSAADDAKSATNKLVDDLHGIGAPDTDSGAKAKSTLNDLADQLKQDIDDLQKTLGESSGVVQSATAVTTTMPSIGNQVTSAFTQLQSIDASGELQKAFTSADSCKSITGN